MSKEILAMHERGWKLSCEKGAKNDQLHAIFLCDFLSFKLPSHSQFVTSKAEKFRIYSIKSGLFENVKGKILYHYGGNQNLYKFILGKN